MYILHAIIMFILIFEVYGLLVETMESNEKLEELIKQQKKINNTPKKSSKKDN